MKIKAGAVALGSAIVLALGTGCGTAAVATHPNTTPPPSPLASTSAPALTAEQIATKLGLRNVFAYNAQTDPNGLLGRQGEYTSKINWGASTSEDSNNSIEVFFTAADAKARLAYLQGFRPPFGDGYDQLKGVYLLRLSSDWTPAKAARIEAQFDQIMG